MKELNSKFLSLLRYVPYIVDEKPKVQRFLSCLPFHIKDRIEYDNPKTLEEAMRKEIFSMSRTEKGKACQTRRLRGLIILNRRRRVSYLTTILGIITHLTFLIRISKEIKVIHSQTLTALETKNLLIITATTLRIMNVKNRQNVGIVMDLTTHQSALKKEDHQQHSYSVGRNDGW